MKIFLKKAISTVLFAAVLLSAFSFVSYAQSAEMPISISVSGIGTVADADGNKADGSALTYSVGSTASFTATPYAGWEFLYWVNTETNRIVSFEETYTFKVATYAVIEAVFEYLDPEYHRVVYLSDGGNIILSDFWALGDLSYEEPDEKIYVGGKTWAGWDMSIAEIAEKPGAVYVYPEYTDVASYTVTTVIDGAVSKKEGQYGTQMSIKAPETLDGEDFSYWVIYPEDPDLDEPQIVSYYADYQFIITNNMTVHAVYGKEDGDGIVTRIAGDIPNFKDSAITFNAERSISTDYTILQHGLILTQDITIGNSESLFVINPDEPLIRKGTSNNTYRAGTYSVTLRNWHDTMISGGKEVDYYPLVFVRSYVIVQNADGETMTVYSRIYCADYVNTTFEGVIEGDNYDDPFANG